MAEGRVFDFEMQDLGQKYPEYDDINLDKLNDQNDSLNQRMSIIQNEVLNENSYNHDEYDDTTNRMRYIDKVRMRILNEIDTSFIDSDDGRTVTINKKCVKTVVPSDEFDNKEEDNDDFYNILDETIDDNEYILDDDILERLKNVKAKNQRDNDDQLERVLSVSKIIQDKEKINLNPNNPNAREILDKSSVTTLTDGTKILYFRSNRGVEEENSGVQILKRGKTKPLYTLTKILKHIENTKNWLKSWKPITPLIRRI